MPNGSISFNPSRASTSNIPTCAVTGSRNICSIGSRWTTLQNTTQRHNSTNLTGSPRDGLPTISAAPRGRRGSAELVTHEVQYHAHYHAQVHGRRGGPLSVPNRGRAVLPGTTFFLFGAATSPSHWAFLRAALRARRIASAPSRAAFSDGFS